MWKKEANKNFHLYPAPQWDKHLGIVSEFLDARTILMKFLKRDEFGNFYILRNAFNF